MKDGARRPKQEVQGTRRDRAEVKGAQNSRPVLGNQDLQREARAMKPEGGQPLAPAVRSKFERRLGQDLSDVRIASGGADGARARGLGTRAYSVDRSIAFAEGHYAPHTAEGDQLLAHELAHVVQRGSGGEQAAISRAGDAAEDDARGFAAGGSAPKASRSAVIHCDDTIMGVCVDTALPLADRRRMYQLALDKGAKPRLQDYFTPTELANPYMTLFLDTGVTAPPGKPVPTAEAVTPEQGAQIDANMKARNEAERRAANPNGYDIMHNDMQILGKAVDPSGMGIAKAPVAIAYMVLGNDSYEEASRKAANVDAFVGLAAMAAAPEAVHTGMAPEFRPTEWGAPVDIMIGDRPMTVVPESVGALPPMGSFLGPAIEIPGYEPPGGGLSTWSDEALYDFVRPKDPSVPESLAALDEAPPKVTVYSPAELNARAKEIHADIIRYFQLGPQASGEFTVSLTQPAGGEIGPVINVTNPTYYQALLEGKIPLKAGELLGSPIELVRGKAQYHAEIMGIWDTKLFGAQGGETTTSIFACGRCGAGIGEGDFAGWTHLNLDPTHDFAATPKGYFDPWVKPTPEQVIAELMRRARARKKK